MKYRTVLLAAIFASIPLVARADDAKQVLTKVSDTYKNLTAYRFAGSVARATGPSASDAVNELKFEIAYESPDKFRIDYRYPTAGDWVRVSDGKTLTRYRSLTKQVNASAASPSDARLIESTPLARYSHLDEVADQAKLVGSETLSVNGRQVDCYIVEIPGEKPRFEGIRSLPVKLWIDKKSDLVYREVAATESGSGSNTNRETRTTEYTDIQTAGDIPDTLFAFSK